MIDMKAYKDLIRKGYDLTSVEFSDLVPGQYYILVSLDDPLKPVKKYIKIIHILRNGSSKVETLPGYKPQSRLPPNIGIWFAIFNLDLHRNKLTPITLKKDNLSFANQLDYGLHWVLNTIPSDINKLA